jgi:hypothetical protein
VPKWLNRSSSTAESSVFDGQNPVPTSMMCDGSSPAVDRSDVLSRFCLILARLRKSSAAFPRRLINSRYLANDSRSSDDVGSKEVAPVEFVLLVTSPASADLWRSQCSSRRFRPGLSHGALHPLEVGIQPSTTVAGDGPRRRHSRKLNPDCLSLRRFDQPPFNHSTVMAVTRDIHPNAQRGYGSRVHIRTSDST